MARVPEIRTRITLDGTRDFQSKLKRVGDRARRAFRGVSRSARAMRESIRKIGSGLASSVGRVTKAFGAVATAAAGAAAAIAAFSEKTSRDITEVVKGAQRAGVALKEFSKISYAGSKFGAETEDIASAVATLSERIAEAAVLGESTATEAFGLLGLKPEDLRDTNGELLKADKVMRLLADKFSKLEDGALKTKIGFDLFSDDFRFIAPLLNQGSDALDKAGEEAQRFGLVLDEEAAEAASNYRKQMAEVTGALRGVAYAIGQEVLPFVTRVAGAFEDWLVDNRDRLQEFAESGVEKVRSILADLFKLISGRGGMIENGWLYDAWFYLDKAKTGAVGFGRDASSAFQWVRETIQPLLPYLDKIADFLGLGNAKQLGIVVALTTMTGLLAPIIASFGLVLKVLGSIWGVLKVVVAGVAAVAGVGTAAAAAIVAGLAAVIGAVVALIYYWDEVKAAIGRAWDFAVERAQWTLRIYQRLFEGLWESIKWIGGGIRDGFSSAWEFVADSARAAFEKVLEYIRPILRAYQKVKGFTLRQLGLGGEEPVPGYSTGGSVRGPGTGTSDSILARLSNGEYVVRAGAVRKYGKAFLDALNGGTLPGFATGGMVGEPSLAMAAVPAGGASNGRPVHLNINGQSFELSGRDDVVERLTRHIDEDAASSAHSKPFWFRG